MNQALWIAKTGLDAQQTKMSNIANNLANAGTTGYKRSRAIFEDLLYQNVRQVGAQSSQDTQLPSGLMIGTGVRVVATEKLFTQGNLAQTENMLDMAIQGRGFFQILLPDGTQAYTRDGSFQVDNQGQMVTSAGYILQPSVTLPENALSVNIGSDGTVSVRQPGSSAVSQVGTIQLADFVNPAGLQPIGENLFLESNASGSPQTGNPGLNGLGTVFQGYVESSNVNVVEELVNMIETQRTYEMNSKAISTTDQMLQYVASNL
ncbi:flagellar basal-body rod protein FlgG [Porticoccus hydrocarbonoclasticus]|jgi:flagellar basal-body rod protein FlgG|uniref:flagellar basal-body rod protein FlgG n=1 Tax=Porticoccus TaxID=1123967 RepID=UPI000564694D|nr:flagellar basal-body rod protein FlgG [Porticoccus hydrocarbonoclasticus]MBG56706.1 flagellar basal-body rod protein FlgG [Porticoccus sp.]PHQ58091.1 MAG: flagellar basal-body rod protein FlgG [Porticoccus sp.]|tara:strand:+ start:16016 stop:16801 length:786 start_codon:yes stop_codon:yes gene_type:complete